MSLRLSNLVSIVLLTNATKEETVSVTLSSSLTSPTLSYLVLFFFFDADVRIFDKPVLILRRSSSLDLFLCLSGEVLIVGSSSESSGAIFL